MMQRIDALDPAEQQGPVRELLENVQRNLGTVPNLARTLGHSAAALKGYLALRAALAESTLGVRLAEQIAIAVANANGCAYSNALHSYLGQHFGELDVLELQLAKMGKASDTKSAAALIFCRTILVNKGQISDNDLSLVRAAGFSDTAIVEIIAHTALNCFVNYFNKAVDTRIDFPVVPLAPEAFL